MMMRSIYCDKIFGQVCPLYLPKLETLVISYERTVEIINKENEFVWKNDFADNIVKISKHINNNFVFISLKNGLIHELNVETFELNQVFSYKCILKDVFLNTDCFLVTNEKILFFKKMNVESEIVVSNHSWDFIDVNIKNDFAVFCQSNKIYATKYLKKTSKYHTLEMHRSNHITCVSCQHKNSTIFATGHANGKILIWLDFFKDTTKFEVLHWHFLSLQTIVWSMNNKYLYSGGRENILVRWNCVENNRNFFPRLDSSICTIKALDDECRIIVQLDDNSCIIMNNDINEIIQRFRSFGQRAPHVHQRVRKMCKKNPIGLIQGLNMNGKFKNRIITNIHEGKAQFYDPINFKVDILDITNQNWPVPQENYMAPLFDQVVKLVLSDNGKTIATIDQNILTEISKLSIYNYSDKNDEWVLEKKIDLEYSGITGLTISPKGDEIGVVNNNLSVFLYCRLKVGQEVIWKIVRSWNLVEHIPNLKPQHNGDALIVYTVVKNMSLLVVAKFKYVFICNVNPNPYQDPLYWYDVSKMKPEMKTSNFDKSRFITTICSMIAIPIIDRPKLPNSSDTFLCLALGCKTGFIVFELDFEYKVHGGETTIKASLIKAARTRAPVTNLAISPDEQLAMTIPKLNSVSILSLNGLDVISYSNHRLSMPPLSCAWIPLNEEETRYGLACLEMLERSPTVRLSVITDEPLEREKPKISKKRHHSIFDEVEDLEEVTNGPAFKMCRINTTISVELQSTNQLFKLINKNF